MRERRGEFGDVAYELARCAVDFEELEIQSLEGRYRLE
jgi:hypothetical protein